MIPGKVMSVIGCRPTMIGDQVMSLCLFAWLRNRYPEAYTNWVVGARCAVAAPLYIGHPHIDRILVSSTDGYGPELDEVVKRCDVMFPPLPQHPTGDIWPNEEGINIYSETFRMSGLPLSEYHSLPEEDKVPRLVQWFRVQRRPKAIAIWPGATQGEKEQRRVPPYEWWVRLVERLQDEGYAVYQCGHPGEYPGKESLGIDVRGFSFMDDIALSLGADLALGTDSGSMVALAAFHSIPTLSLLSPHWPHHTLNPLAFGPLGKRHRNMWAPGHDKHDIEAVVAAVKEMV